jgi:hypothetical protein
LVFGSILIRAALLVVERGCLARWLGTALLPRSVRHSFVSRVTNP